MKTYRYRSYSTWVTKIVALFWIVFAVLFLALSWYNFLTDSLRTMNVDTLLLLSLAMLLASVGGMMLFCLFPDVTVCDKGFYVKYLLGIQFFTPWEEVVSVEPSLASFTGKTYLVLTKRLTFVHRLIGLSQSFSFHPGFLVGPGMEERGELLRLIRQHTE